MARLHWYKQNQPAAGLSGRRRCVNSACTDLVRLAHISDPVFLWPSDAADCHFFYNHNMRSGASSQRHEKRAGGSQSRCW